jgi:hypothetical protein
MPDDATIRAQAHAEGEHAFCGPECDTTAPPDDYERATGHAITCTAEHGTAGQASRGDHVRTVVEFFLQCQQPDGTWETASSAMDSQERAEGRIAKRRVSMPAFGHRVVRRTTTTITSEMEPVEVRSNASYPREGDHQ